MTNSTASSTGGLFDTTFSTGATVLAVVATLVALAAAWFGYQDSAFPVLGIELTIITGAISLLFGLLVALVALVAAIYMEPGFDK